MACLHDIPLQQQNEKKERKRDRELISPSSTIPFNCPRWPGYEREREREREPLLFFFEGIHHTHMNRQGEGRIKKKKKKQENEREIRLRQLFIQHKLATGDTHSSPSSSFFPSSFSEPNLLVCVLEKSLRLLETTTTTTTSRMARRQRKEKLAAAAAAAAACFLHDINRRAIFLFSSGTFTRQTGSSSSIRYRLVICC